MLTKIKRHLFVLFVLSICMPQSEFFAQSNPDEDIVTAPNSVFGEFFGQGMFLSANYDRMLFNTTPHNVALRAGLGLWVDLRIGSSEESGVTIPLNISYLFGGNHKFELGLGYTLAPDISLKLGKGTIATPGTLTTIIGYRYQPVDGGFLFRIGVVFYLTAEEAITGMGGLSFGYAF